MGFFDRLSAGWTAGKSCLEVLRNDKKLIVFPVLSGLCAIIVFASFAIPLAVIKPVFLKAMMDERHVNVQQTPIWFWIALFLFYFANYFVIYFFNAALVHCALFHFRGQPVTAIDGLQAAIRRLPELLAWAFVSATVGLILKLIENANERVGSFISAILGGAWTVVTYFVVPVLVVERVGPMQAIKRSWQILCKTWGESIGGHAGVGWALLPFWLLGILFVLLAVFAFAASPILGGFLIGLSILYFLVLGLVDATLKGILLGALYLYSTHGEVPEEFERESLNHSFVPKKA
jgi:hypothetical protein